MKKLIFNADDFGLSEGVNYGILNAHLDGVVTSTTIMANMPAFDHAIAIAKQYPTLKIGVHLTLSCGKPVLENHKTIINDGLFYRRITDELVKSVFDLDEVYNEYCAQIEKVLATGIKITHMDSHHHAHTTASLLPVLQKLSDKYQLPFRGLKNFEVENNQVIPCLPYFYEDYATVDTIAQCVDHMEDEQVVDVMCHPAYLDYKLMETTAYNAKRLDEHKVLTSKELKQLLKDKGVKLTNYQEL